MILSIIKLESRNDAYSLSPCSIFMDAISFADFLLGLLSTLDGSIKQSSSHIGQRLTCVEGQDASAHYVMMSQQDYAE